MTTRTNCVRFAILGLLLLGQTVWLASAAQAQACDDGRNVGYGAYPKLYHGSARTLGRAISCARLDLKQQVTTSADLIYGSMPLKTQDDFVDAATSIRAFYEMATGEKNQATKSIYYAAPGDARAVLRLAVAAFFEDGNIALNYRKRASAILLLWARNTNKAGTPMVGTLSANGLELGSSITAFAAGFDYLMAGGPGGIPTPTEAEEIRAWIARAAKYIADSNDVWMAYCRDNISFSYEDGMSCSRARGDNHLTIATAALYVIGVTVGNINLQSRALRNASQFPGLGWGYEERIGYIIHNVNDPLPEQDRYVSPSGVRVHTGEIYDRWRGQYIERAGTRRLQLHRGMAYTFLSLTGLATQALAAKPRGVDLTAPYTLPNGKTIKLLNAFRFYAELIKNYDPWDALGGEPSEFFSSESNYSTHTYCVSGHSGATIPLLEDCPILYAPDGEIEAEIDPYFFATLSAGKALIPATETAFHAALNQVITIDKMDESGKAYFGHVMPYEPVLLIEKVQP